MKLTTKTTKANGEMADDWHRSVSLTVGGGGGGGI